MKRNFYMFMRRGHLYFGLFLLPWAVLYGVTAFLFNHPTAFSDANSVSFDRAIILGTPLEEPVSESAIAAQVVAALNVAQKPAVPYSLAGEAKFLREFAFATGKTETGSVSVLIDLKTGSGTIRTADAKKEQPKPPFVVGSSQPRGKGGRNATPRGEGMKLENPLGERVKAALPRILEAHSIVATDLTVTSVPEIGFTIIADGQPWPAVFNPLTGSVSAGATAEDLGWRRFLLRLHTAHGYPGETNARWAWAVVVDLMAFVMCFWGVSGLVMWWKIRSQRIIGGVILTLSAACATTLGVAMHMAMTS